jgi:osmotically inducible protein OsmC
MKIQRTGKAQWTGGTRDGRGALSTTSGALRAHPFGFASRFEGQPGTNPEELIAAAHAGCFTLVLVHVLQEAGLRAERLETEARVTLEKSADGFVISAVQLELTAHIPGIDAAAFAALAERAKGGCPVSKLLRVETGLRATLEAPALSD